MKSPMTADAMSRASPLLAALPEAARSQARAITLAPAGRLFLRGDTPEAMYCVLSGEVHLSRSSEQGAEIVLQRCRGGFLAEASLDQRTYHCDAIAKQACEVIAIPRPAFRAALDDERFRFAWIEHLARELRRVRTQAERLSLRTARERIEHYLLTEGDNGAVTLGQSRKAWARELGLSHEALYRELARLQDAGRLGIDGDRLSLSGGTGPA